MDKEEKKERSDKKIKVDNKEGLRVMYNKKELKEFFPYLTKEVFEKKKSIKMEAINDEIEQKVEEDHQISNQPYPNELYNPGVIDFIRRCYTKEEAIDILDYLLKRNEINNKEYKKYRSFISQEDGLIKLINESGGFKRPGYYMRKYYKRISYNQKLNKSKD